MPKRMSADLAEAVEKDPTLDTESNNDFLINDRITDRDLRVANALRSLLERDISDDDVDRTLSILTEDELVAQYGDPAMRR